MGPRAMSSAGSRSSGSGRQVYQAAVQQATLLSYLDDFKALGLIFLALPPLLLWVRPGTGVTGPGPSMTH